MRVKIEKGQLSTATSRSQGAVSERNLAQLGFLAREGQLHIAAADRVIAIYNRLDCEVLQEGSVFVPAKLFSDVVRELPDGMVEIISEDNQVIVIAGEKKEFTMKLPRVEDRAWQEPPVLEASSEALLPTEKLAYIIDQVQFCVVPDSPRNYGSVGYLHRPKDNSLRLVGTDGYRLSYAEVELELPEHFLKNGVCLSKRALQELHRMCSEGFTEIALAVSQDQTTMEARVPGYQLFVRLSAVRYPNYYGVLPRNSLSHVKVQRPYLQNVAKRVLLASDKTRALQLCFSDYSLTLRSRTLGSSEGQESIALADYSDGERELAINGKFLTDVFSTMSSDEVTINFGSDEDPIVLVPFSEPTSCHSMHVLVPIKES
ncbi:MAG TPA: DNA polymerase III subunit beta [Oligoflexus sp.]|jgi:DNA polymerase-3 subunit beta|uniref:DNA polymerase III subunit beta n=1 Tax=Oligoflexus sp. TaxID=1971216 RepID=UPI002D80CFC1|nr:DNA polymerase III subunit beta [Oligoflexus sp.]HET9238883.1 DNA polymerase III subunit beta [Oligoflexus sp.]